MDALGSTLVMVIRRLAESTADGTERLDLIGVVPGLYTLRVQVSADVALRQLIAE